MKITLSVDGGGPKLAALGSAVTSAATVGLAAHSGGLSDADALQLAVTTAFGALGAFLAGTKTRTTRR